MTTDTISVARTDVVAGYTLSPFTIEMFAQASAEFARKHLAVVSAVAEQSTARVADMLLRVASDQLAAQVFTFDNAAFRACCFAPENTPFLLYLSLGPKHPDVTVIKARRIIDENIDREPAIRVALNELMGYRFSQLKGKGESDPKKPSPAAEPTPSAA
jgi:hypothetical protein